MIMPDFGPQIDGQWIDYYALLEMPVDSDEDTIRRRIGKAYADASANSEHRDTKRRNYYRSLVERVLPQCRRIMLDSEWRARYDQQHSLHREKDGSAQSYVEFIGSMRGESNAGSNEALLPQHQQEELNTARQVVQTALSGAELELLPSEAISNMMAIAAPAGVAAGAPAGVAAGAPAGVAAGAPAGVAAGAPDGAPAQDFSTIPEVIPMSNAAAKAARAQDVARSSGPIANERRNAPHEIVAQVQPVEQISASVAAPVKTKTTARLTTGTTPVDVTQVGATEQSIKEARATVITAQEAADIRRRRASNPDSTAFVAPTPRDTSPRRNPRSRVAVDVEGPARRKLSSTSLNLMVAITGVLLTITIQRFAESPAIATSAGRIPIVLAVAPEMQGVIENASIAWEQTPGGASYDVVVQTVASSVVMQRALGKSGDQIDGWIPANASYAQRYNELAPGAKRPILQIGDSLAQTPMVLVARSDKAAALRRAFPNHKIGTWSALRSAVMKDAKGRFGLSDPRQSLPGTLARFSMAREWGQSQNKTPEAAAKNANFWKWMAGFEENIPSSAALPEAMVKDMVLGTTGRYWWAISYESDALKWIGQGKALELYYLPRTALADHPFCAVERVGAPLEVASGRAAFVDYLKSDNAQQALLQSGFRPTEISPATDVEKNPFTSTQARARGVQLQGLPRDERFKVGDLSVLQKQWSQYYG